MRCDISLTVAAFIYVKQILLIFWLQRRNEGKRPSYHQTYTNRYAICITDNNKFNRESKLE